MSMPKYIFEVYSEGPAGSYPIGFFYDENEAKRAQESWNAEHRHAWDAAILVKHSIR